MKHHAIALGLALLFARPHLAHADDPPPPAETAADLRRRGDDAMDQRRAAEALEAYRRAEAIEATPALLDNLGRALLATGDFAGALASFEAYQREAPEELKARTHLLAQIMSELEAKVATVEIAGSHARVCFDEPVGAAAPGQAAVLYDGPRVLGGGWITG